MFLVEKVKSGSIERTSVDKDLLEHFHADARLGTPR